MARRALLALALVLVAATAAVAAYDEPCSSRLEPGPCRTQVLDGRAPAGLDRRSLGRTPAPYEVGAPAGGRRPARVMMLIHGGAWQKVGQGAMNSMGREAAGWRAAGWQTVNAGYRSCARSLPDVLALYGRVRASVGARVPICVDGESAGAHLALLLAARRAVACVIAKAAPTDLRTLAAQGRTGAGPDALREGSAWVAEKGVTAFGPRHAVRASPVFWARRIHARVLLAASADDDLVPVAQQRELYRALRAAGVPTELDVLAGGSEGFVHAGVSPVALQAYRQHVAATVAPFGRPPGQRLDGPILGVPPR